MEKIANRILEGMKQKGYTPADLSRAAKVSKSTISKLLNNQPQVGSPESLAKIARALGIPEQEFFMDKGIMKDTPERRRDAELLRLEKLHSRLPKEDREVLFDFANMLFSRSQGQKRKPIYEREHR